MATTVEAVTKPRRVCFSFAAYAKNLIDHLKSSNVPVAGGLSHSEFSAVESAFHFTFPPDLRSILREGLPVGPGFPNWRSSSTQQLEILTNLPFLGILKEVSRSRFWLESWGDRPEDDDQAVALAKGFLRNVPVLVPVYRNCYIATVPNMAGNPVFHVNGGEVKLWSFDITGFFQQVEFGGGKEGGLKRRTLSNFLNAPAWAATEARRVAFWTELAERGEQGTVVRGGTRWWWRGELGGCLEEVCWRLRDGGWKEEDVREMMMMDGRDDEAEYHVHDRERRWSPERGVAWHVRVLSLRLLRAGWSTEDVVDSLGLPPEDHHHHHDGVDREAWLEFRYTSKCDDGQNRSIKQLMNMHSIEERLKVSNQVAAEEE
ncbi:hypothetical protein RJ639_039187 [Escallonia herrerae]|uniref:Knr4/Smi1-like domain-containing protein n=1 Tax=Escallonia herrerae TaxID=1293975 RepID=A0AA88WS82_9ASTE|nr:hypothetical protein RJ639_039187 [Escallonia herrerae]